MSSSSGQTGKKRPSLLKDLPPTSSSADDDDDDEDVVVGDSSDSDVVVLNKTSTSDLSNEVPAPYRGNARAPIPGQDTYLRPLMKKKSILHRGVYIRMEDGKFVALPPKKRGLFYTYLSTQGPSGQEIDSQGSSDNDDPAEQASASRKKRAVSDMPKGTAAQQQHNDTAEPSAGPSYLHFSDNYRIGNQGGIGEGSRQESPMEAEPREGLRNWAIPGNGHAEDHAGAPSVGSSGQFQQVDKAMHPNLIKGGLLSQHPVGQHSSFSESGFSFVSQSRGSFPVLADIMIKSSTSTLRLEVLDTNTAGVARTPGKVTAAMKKRPKPRKRLFTKKPTKPKNRQSSPKKPRANPPLVLEVVAENEPFDEEPLKGSDEPLHCFCRKDTAGTMVKCSNVLCPMDSGWFHTSCVQLPEKFSRWDIDWFCDFCRRDPESPGVMRSMRSIAGGVLELCYRGIALGENKTMLELHFRC